MPIWGNPPPFKSDPPKQSKLITPESLAGDSESSHQKALFAWAALSVGKYSQLKWMHAIPNGGLRDVRTATNLKAEGVKAGVLDIFLPWPVGKWHGAYIEMKYGKNKVTQEQKEFIDFIGWNYKFIVCYTWIEAKDIIIKYLEGKL